jgi:hypothetical protein
LKSKSEKENNLSESSKILNEKFKSMSSQIDVTKRLKSSHPVKTDLYQQQVDKIINSSQNLYDIMYDGIIRLNKLEASDFSNLKF